MISIIIPLYNKQHVIKNTINSILTQSVSDWECIIVDDGSTDSSASVVRGIDDKRIKYLYKSNGGVSSARNFGVEHASGEWILFLDADDLLLEDCLATFYQYNSSKNIDIIAANFYLVNGNKSVAHNFCVKEGILSHPFIYATRLLYN
jgi:glycosyltransferase involved in cell wall biosynthesis